MKAKVSQQEAANHLGIYQPQISDMERGMVAPSEQQLEQLENLFDIPAGCLTRHPGLERKS